MLVLLPKLPSRTLSFAFAMLAIITLCGILSVFSAYPQPDDALSVLKSLAPYPNAQSVTFSGNKHYATNADMDWRYPSGPSGSSYVILTNDQRDLSVTIASLTFKTSDGTQAVEKFYRHQATLSEYQELEGDRTLQRYLRWETARSEAADAAAMFGLHLYVPVTFYEMRINPSPAGLRTDVMVRLSIFRETGGLRP